MYRLNLYAIKFPSPKSTEYSNRKANNEAEFLLRHPKPKKERRRHWWPTHPRLVAAWGTLRTIESGTRTPERT
ncbi:hypothetical protein PoMZ_12759 [Pyricularia oryzae]|uniref:Uncharacterized protein n=1 Tax=Pyricularia oryzae TaxID=318829 RepID=A0A4P7NTF3_PYROR|nr:hypothetical protein PoMZ_12759 [Pyricularia oryzae]